MTPGELLNATLHYCGVVVVVAFTLALCCLMLVGFILFAGWIASLFRKPAGWGDDGSEVVAGPNGMPMRVVHFPGGQRGTVPFPDPRETLNGRPVDTSELMQ